MRFQTLFEARWIFAILVLLGVASYFISLWLLLLIFLLLVYTISFFRDPERVVPADADAVVVAADGTVADIIEIEETEVLNSTRRRIGIVLSLLVVHTKRDPMDERIIYQK